MRVQHLVLLACTLLTACATTLRKTDVDVYGAKTYAVSREMAFAASVDALKRLGYPIAEADPQRGLIKTRAVASGVIVDQVPAGDGSTMPVHTPEERQYTVEVGSLPDGRVEVRAMPQVFHHGANVSDRRVWQLSEERAHWAAFFQAVDRAL